MSELIKETSQHLIAGNTILYPTDTVWGIGCDATNFEAITKVYQLKKRSESKSLIVLVSSLSMLKKYVSVPKSICELLKKSNQPTTIIYENPTGFAKNAIASDGTIAIRVVLDPFCRKLIKKFQKPIISTSANISNFPTPNSLDEVKKIFDDPDVAVYAHNNGDALKPSSIIDLKTMEYIRE